MQKTPKDINEYIELLPEKSRAILEELRQVVKNAVPEAEEVISYQMPAFNLYGILVWIAAFKNHYTIFTSSSIIKDFPEALEKYELTKSKAGIKIPLSEPVPVELLTVIVKSKARINLEKEQLKAKRK